MVFDEDRIPDSAEELAARQRMFSASGLLAVAKAKKRGLPITYAKGEQIIREYADGRKEVIGSVAPDVKIACKTFHLR